MAVSTISDGGHDEYVFQSWTCKQLWIRWLEGGLHKGWPQEDKESNMWHTVAGAPKKKKFTRGQYGHKTSLSFQRFGLDCVGLFSISQWHASQIILIFNICYVTYIWLHAIQVTIDKLSASRALYCSVPLFTSRHGCKYLWQVLYCYLAPYLDGT